MRAQMWGQLSREREDPGVTQAVVKVALGVLREMRWEETQVWRPVSEVSQCLLRPEESWDTEVALSWAVRGG